MGIFRKIARFGFGVVTMAAMAFLFTSLPLEAAKQSKIDICHLDSTTGLFMLLSVPAHAQQAHYNHGDIDVPPSGDCNAQPAKVFARAYINIDGQPGYQEAVDLIIAQIVDTDGSGDISVGDDVQFSTYPRSFTDLTDRDLFQAPSLKITQVQAAVADEIVLSVTDALNSTTDLVVFANSSIQGETFVDLGGNGGTVGFTDATEASGGGQDAITVEPGPLSMGTSMDNVLLSRTDNADDAFINVEINLAGL